METSSMETSSRESKATTRSSAAASGLEGVVVADTRLSDVDGERGQLIIGGYDVEELAGRSSFEDVCLLLWQDKLPGHSAQERMGLQAELGAARRLAFEKLGQLGDALAAADGMDALRAAVAHLGPVERVSTEALVTGAMAVFAAAWARRQAGRAPVAPDEALDHAADYLRMIRGEPASAELAAGLAAYLVTVSDHGMNASTFTARVVASTGSDLVSAVVAALGALKGPLHGGAPGPVLDMLDAIGSPDRATAWLEAELLAGRRIMGMGHRIYRVRDPRALVLERAITALLRGPTQADGAGESARLPLARAVEQAAEGVLRARHPNRPLHANVEFYTAVLLDALGLPRTLFSPTFAVGRVAGWCAHVREQREVGRLIRPASRFAGVPRTLGAP
jgi:citrate synthase